MVLDKLSHNFLLFHRFAQNWPTALIRDGSVTLLERKGGPSDMRGATAPYDVD